MAAFRLKAPLASIGWLLLVWPAALAGAQPAPGNVERAAASKRAGPATPPSDLDKVAATVGDEPVYVAEAMQVLRSTRAGESGASATAWLQAQALEQVVNRQAAIAGLAARGFAAGAEDVDRLLDDLRQRLAGRQLELADFLRQEQITEPMLRRQLSWEFTWNQFLESQLTDEALERHFNAQPREFDGAQLRVRHILLRKPEPDTSQAWQSLEERAQKLREEILAKKISFEAAAEKYSAGPSRRQGGDLGVIERRGAMVEEFSRAAFKLNEGEISPPVRTRFGVHLIQCASVVPGNIPWTEARRDLAKALAQSLFFDLACQSRSKLPVKFTGAMPYLDPASGRLIESPSAKE